MTNCVDAYVRTVSNVPALLKNKDFLNTLHLPHTTDLIVQYNDHQVAAAGNGIRAPIATAIQTLLDTGNQPNSTVNKHSIGMAGLLLAKTRTQLFQGNDAMFSDFLGEVRGLMRCADWEQLRMVAGVLTEIGKVITNQLIERQNPMGGIILLGEMARSLQEHNKMLTCVHAFVLQLCCASSNFKAGLAYVMDDFEEFTRDLKWSENTKYLLSYLYYAGVLHTALKSFDKAIFFFEACMKVPAITLSHIMLESYKKYVLTSLIHIGTVKAPSPRQHSSQVINRILQPLSAPYDELARSFSSGNAGTLDACVTKYAEAWGRDGNAGLVKQVVAARKKQVLGKLMTTFVTLGLSDVARMVGCEESEAEKLVLGMIEKEGVMGKISQRDGMVTFLDSENEGNSSSGGNVIGKANLEVQKKWKKRAVDETQKKNLLEDKINTCMDLNRRLTEMSEAISKCPKYIARVVSMSGDAGGNSGSSSHTSLLGRGSGTSVGSGGSKLSVNANSGGSSESNLAAGDGGMVSMESGDVDADIAPLVRDGGGGGFGDEGYNSTG